MNLEKFEAVNNRMNKITAELLKNTELSEGMLTSTEELADILTTVNTKKTPQENATDYFGSNSIQTLTKPKPTEPTDNELIPVIEMAAEIVDVEAMISDFSYMRTMLRETTENSRRVLESVTEELVLAERESRAGLVMAFSELNKSQMEGIKLFMQSYKEVSTILVNFSKLQKENKPSNVYTTNVLNLESSNVSSADIINRLNESK